MAADVLRGDVPISHWDSTIGEFILDVREPFELAVESHPRAVNIPLGQLRGRLDELPRDREIHVICRSGTRAYFATRILLQNGFRAKDLSDGCSRSPTWACSTPTRTRRSRCGGGAPRCRGRPRGGLVLKIQRLAPQGTSRMVRVSGAGPFADGLQALGPALESLPRRKPRGGWGCFSSATMGI